MRVARKALFLDTLIQGLLMGSILTGLVVVLAFNNGEWAIISLYGMVLLGIWQLGGNLLWLLGRKDTERRYYLLIVLLYFGIGWLAATFSPSGIMSAVGLIYWLILPFGIAIWYFRISITRLMAYPREPRSFWDI